VSPSAEPTATTPTSSPSAAIPALEPSAAPEVQGTLRYRSVLSIEKPDWSPGRVNLAFQWLRDGSRIPKATGTSYRLTGGDIGHRVSVRITGSKDGYEPAEQETEAVGPVRGAALEPRTPDVTGTAKVGRTLAGSVDAWGPGEVSLAWQWYRDGDKIAGATGRTYRLVVADLAHVVRLRIRGTAENYEAASAYSAKPGPVAEGTLDPTPTPLYSGTSKVGHTLTALPREWGPGEVALAYQWYRSGKKGDVKIDGATKVTYRLAAADEGHRLRVRVSGSKAGYTTVRRYSAWTSIIDPGDLVPATPEITGMPVAGRDLTAVPGEWSPSGVTFTYRWYRSGLLNTRALDATYALSALDVGHTITVQVTGHRDGYRDHTVESEPTATVVARER
jgi:hypothetical protein